MAFPMMDEYDAMLLNYNLSYHLKLASQIIANRDSVT